MHKSAAHSVHSTRTTFTAAVGGYIAYLRTESIKLKSVAGNILLQHRRRQTRADAGQRRLVRRSSGDAVRARVGPRPPGVDGAGDGPRDVRAVPVGIVVGVVGGSPRALDVFFLWLP